MIRLTEASDFPQLLEFCRGNPFGCRIASLALAYGFEAEFLQFWLQYTEEGSVSAAVSRLNGAVTIQSSEKTDWDELMDFLVHIGYSSVIKEATREESTGVVMELAGKIPTVKKQPVFLETPPLAALYTLLDQCREEGFQPPPFEEFYVDISHRLRHQTAHVAVAEADGKPAACAFALWETKETAVLAGVAVAPGARGKGLGKAVVSHIIEKLPGKRIYLFRAKGKNGGFYRSLGFSDTTYFWEGK